MKKATFFVVFIYFLVIGCSAPNFGLLYEKFEKQNVTQSQEKKEEKRKLPLGVPIFLEPPKVDTISVMPIKEKASKLDDTFCYTQNLLRENAYPLASFFASCNDWEMSDFEGELSNPFMTVRALILAYERQLTELQTQ